MRGARLFFLMVLAPLFFFPLWAEELGSVPEGAKAPVFELAGFDLQAALQKGPVVLVFYRGLF